MWFMALHLLLEPAVDCGAEMSWRREWEKLQTRKQGKRKWARIKTVLMIYHALWNFKHDLQIEYSERMCII